jgi:hypothetical protein
MVDLYRLGREQFAEVTASSIPAPTMAATMTFGAATPGGGNATYSGLTMEDFKDGKIATSRADGFAFTLAAQQAGKAEKMTGNMANFAAARAANHRRQHQSRRRTRYHRQSRCGNCRRGDRPF